MRAVLYPGDYAWVEVVDQGGAWAADEHDDEHGRGLASWRPSPVTATGASTATACPGWRGSGSTGPRRELRRSTRKSRRDIRAQIADGTLLPGQPAPSGAALARADRLLRPDLSQRAAHPDRDGVLVPGASPNARPRVPSRATPGERTVADAARTLSESLSHLAPCRRADASPTRRDGRARRSPPSATPRPDDCGSRRRFWERADKALCARRRSSWPCTMPTWQPPSRRSRYSGETPDAAGQADGANRRRHHADAPRSLSPGPRYA